MIPSPHQHPLSHNSSMRSPGKLERSKCPGSVRQVETSTPGAINNTWLRRHLTLTSIAILKRFRPWSGRVLFLTPKICVKYGTTMQLSEVAAMELVRKSTSVPAPKVHCSFRRKGVTYLVMERIEGDLIGSNWHQRTEASRAELLSQLRSESAALRG